MPTKILSVICVLYLQLHLCTHRQNKSPMFKPKWQASQIIVLQMQAIPFSSAHTNYTQLIEQPTLQLNIKGGNTERTLPPLGGGAYTGTEVLPNIGQTDTLISLEMQTSEAEEMS